MNLSSLPLTKVHKALIGLLALFFLILYFPYVRLDPILKRDDLILILPLKNIHSITEYINAVKTNAVVDVQPVRDLSFYINLKIDEWTGLQTFHLTNIILMIFCIHLVFRIFTLLRWSKNEIIIGVLLFSCHPILVSAMGWISTRKHILGLTFILLSLLDVLKKERLSKTSVIWYFTSILSHQIFILFPAWLFIFVKQRKWKFSKSLFGLMCFGGVFVLGLGYYKTFLLEMGNANMNYYSTAENIGRFILSSGRAAIILLFPNVISHAYYQGSIYNMIGIGVLVLFLYLIYKSPARKEGFLWIILAVVTLLPTYIAFVNDTYLYLPLIALIICLVTLLRPFTSKNLAIGAVIAISLLTLKTVTASQMWLSDFRLWQYSYEQEKAPQAALLLGHQLLLRDPKLALEFIEMGVKDYDLISDAHMLIFFVTTIHESNLPIEKKISILEENHLDHEIYNGMYGLVLLSGNKAQEEKGIFLLKKVLKPEKENPENSIAMKITRGIRELCLKSYDKTYICQELNIKY